MTKLTSLRASDLLALASAATTVADIDPVVAEFERRLANRAAKANALKGAKGEQANASILGHVAENLSRVQAMRTKLATPPKPRKAAKAEADPVHTFLANLTPAQLEALRKALA